MIAVLALTTLDAVAAKAGTAALTVGQISGMMGVNRGMMITAGLGRAAQTAMLRQRDDYESAAAMIESEIAIITSELSALRQFNDTAENELIESRSELERLRQEGLANRRAELTALQRQVEQRKQLSQNRLMSAERELATTSGLLEEHQDELSAQGEVETDDPAVLAWRAREERLKVERDRLRELLRRVAELAGSLG